MIEGKELENLVGELKVVEATINALIYVSERDGMIAEGYIYEKLSLAHLGIGYLMNKIYDDDHYEEVSKLKTCESCTHFSKALENGEYGCSLAECNYEEESENA